jgi:hypothetical protein
LKMPFPNYFENALFLLVIFELFWKWQWDFATNNNNLRTILKMPFHISNLWTIWRTRSRARPGNSWAQARNPGFFCKPGNSWSRGIPGVQDLGPARNFF